MTVKRVLVIGGGVTGSVVSIALAQKGVDVTLVEISPQWFGVGHGITVHGNALRAFEQIGLADKIIAGGVPFYDIDVRHADGHTLVKVPTPRTGGPDLPATLGTLRADLQTVLVDEIRALGIDVRLGVTATAFAETDAGVEASLSTGETETFDLVIAADGIRSATREVLGMSERPGPSGMGIWRFVTSRTPDMDGAAVFYHGPWYKAGYAPISATECYAYILTDPVRPDDGRTNAEIVRELAEGYHGPWDHLRESITEDTYMNFQPIEWLLVEGSWHRGRVIAIGDAVHACPPLIAQGAAMCAEDAVLLADYVTRDGELEQLLTEFEGRRLPRVKMVVDASMKMVDWELHPGTPGADPAKLMESSLAKVAEPV
ncbi:2-polyprenyl-6-methoxyphenol hydroxylase-like FAD-dependent oxidoreductase [Homoserinimonas aerilata]|uniref:2-polyprenyl-6-methoxyphenol hydroxylase-like FAD-dependent oxidoreductase n=1 Tax=Homoserinimonas aerilata TaxID=1162970 RepID=A0A542YK06_9MICO|nr:FAD-dependent monooxygenase [Homoserinimonas aerilata]TQL48405.1 2-polyprenyl-6-methoxyphenol hydroxylase-like FAD-dependent oxidoreductase [Homoserinimonas aerilata]